MKDSTNDRFRRQYGVLHRIEALGDGVSSRQIKRRVASGQWIVVSPGVLRHAALNSRFWPRSSLRAEARWHRTKPPRTCGACSSGQKRALGPRYRSPGRRTLDRTASMCIAWATSIGPGCGHYSPEHLERDYQRRNRLKLDGIDQYVSNWSQLRRREGDLARLLRQAISQTRSRTPGPP